MNLSRRVWLPPDGDRRLVRFQDDLVCKTGRMELAAVPPYVHLDPADRIPVGPVEAGSWRLDAGQPVLDALDSRGLLGVFRFGLAWGPVWADDDLASLPPLRWRWSRGRFAVLELSQPDPWFALWSWKWQGGWRSGPPKP